MYQSAQHALCIRYPLLLFTHLRSVHTCLTECLLCRHRHVKWTPAGLDVLSPAMQWSIIQWWVGQSLFNYLGDCLSLFPLFMRYCCVIVLIKLLLFDLTDCLKAPKSYCETVEGETCTCEPFEGHTFVAAGWNMLAFFWARKMQITISATAHQGLRQRFLCL